MLGCAIKNRIFVPASRHPRNSDGQFSTGPIRPDLVRIPDSPWARDRPETLFRRPPARQVRGLVRDGHEAFGEAAEARVHEGAGVSESGRRGAALHGPRRVRAHGGHLGPQAELTLTAVIRLTADANLLPPFTWLLAERLVLVLMSTILWEPLTTCVAGPVQSWITVVKSFLSPTWPFFSFKARAFLRSYRAIKLLKSCLPKMSILDSF